MVEVSPQATTGLKSLVNKRVTKEYKFMGQTIEISKLSVNQVLEIQDKVKKNGMNSEEDFDEGSGFSLLKDVIQMSCEEAKDLSDDDFKSLPLEELSKLSNEIMQYSGMSVPEGK